MDSFHILTHHVAQTCALTIVLMPSETPEQRAQHKAKEGSRAKAKAKDAPAKLPSAYVARYRIN